MNGTADNRIDRIALGLAVAACVLGSLLRITSPAWNFATVGALALFTGGRLRGPLAYAAPLVLMFCTDAALALARPDYSFIHAGTFWCAGSYLLGVLMGRFLFNTENPLALGGMALANSVLFFLITNFGAWIDLAFVKPGLPYSYEPTAAGLLECYVKGIPFYRGTFAGDLIFSAVLFGSYALLIRAYPAYRLQPADAHLVIQDDSDEVRRDH